jgi:hypothetical protein
VVLAEPSPEALEQAARLSPARDWDGVPERARRLAARSHHLVLGPDLRDPVDFIICWTPDGAEGSREITRASWDISQVLRLADGWGIPVVNLANGQGPDRIAQLLKKLGIGG